MAKIELQTPSEKIIDKNKEKKEIIDAQGRVFTLRIPDALDEFDLYNALGNNVNNQLSQGMAISLGYISAIDGESFAIPTTFNEVRAAIKRIGRDGFTAISSVLPGLIGEVASQEEKVAEIKK